jgi:hypothetical protein
MTYMGTVSAMKPNFLRVEMKRARALEKMGLK